MPHEKRAVFDGATELGRGMDSGQRATRLPVNQVSMAVNCTFRGGYLEVRPGYQKVGLTFPDATTRSGFKSGLFQGATVYEPTVGHPNAYASVNGKLYQIDLFDGAVKGVTMPGGNNSAIRPKAYFLQAEDYLIAQDGESRACILDGGKWRRSSASRQEVPTGTVMAYGMGRIWVARPWGTTFEAGDLVYSVTGEKVDVLRFTENDFLAEGGGFAVPNNLGGITAMVFMPQLDTSLGQGPLLVLTPQGIFSVSAPIDRTLWKNLTYPIQTVSMIGFGALADNSTVLVNGDLFYRAFDGVRSFVMAQRQFRQWGNVPISREMNRVFSYDTRHMLKHSSAIVFDNRVLMTASPSKLDGHGVYFRGVGVLDLDPAGSVLGSEPPAWDGLWTGVNVLQLLKTSYDGEELAYAFVLSPAEEIELWKLTRDRRFDNQSDRISAEVEFRSMDFQSPDTLKELQMGDLWIDRVAGKVDMAMAYRSDHRTAWTAWGSETATEGDYEVSDADLAALDGAVPTWEESYRTRIGYTQPGDAYDSDDKKKVRTGYAFQPKLSITGSCRVRALRLKAITRPDEPFARQDK